MARHGTLVNFTFKMDCLRPLSIALTLFKPFEMQGTLHNFLKFQGHFYNFARTYLHLYVSGGVRDLIRESNRVECNLIGIRFVISLHS